MRFCHIFFLIATATFAQNAFAQGLPKDYILPVEATVQANPIAAITLHWPADTKAQHFYISRRLLGNGDPWALIISLPGSDTSYADKAVQAGTQYEYRVIDSTKNDSVYAVFGFLASGIEVPSNTQPGAVDLMVDNTYSTPLKVQIDQLITDLTVEGWEVIRHDVSRTDSVPYIQDTIENDLNNLPNLRTVFLLGHVPVPYSGDIAPDGHVPGLGNHQGAWPADVYYGNFGTNWTDDFVDDTTSYYAPNKNIPGDGKFDQDAIEAPMDLEVGRVDLYNMPDFSLSDTALMKQYLERDHAFRTGQFTAPTRALIDDNFYCIPEKGVDIENVGGKNDTFPYTLPLDYDAPATNGWRNVPSLVGSQNTFDFHLIYSDTFNGAHDWFSYLDTAKYLWAYGCGGGTFVSCGGVSYTTEFADSGYSAIFSMQFGSFFGDWNEANNLLRAPLCTSYGLTDCWAGRPYWYFHPLGIGETFGYCARLSQDVSGDVNWGTLGVNLVVTGDYMSSPSMQGVHVALMGDPTLRMIYLCNPPTALSVSVGGNSIKLTWDAPSNLPSGAGYNIYRADATGDTLLQINTSLVTTTTFTDLAPLTDSNLYVVRAAKLQTTPSGTWWNESGGVMQGVNFIPAGVAQSSNAPAELTVNEDGAFLDIAVSEESSSAVNLAIIDMAGRTIATLADGAFSPGVYNYRFSTAALTSGAYFVRLIGSSGLETAKVAVVH